MEKKNVKEAAQKLKEQDMELVAGGATTKKRRPEVILQPNDKKIRKF